MKCFNTDSGIFEKAGYNVMMTFSAMNVSHVISNSVSNFIRNLLVPLGINVQNSRKSSLIQVLQLNFLLTVSLSCKKIRFMISLVNKNIGCLRQSS